MSLTAGSGGIVAASANNTTAEIATTGASVTMDTTGPIGSSSNRIQFADNANTTQQNVIIGSSDQPSSDQPSSVYLDGLGSLTLGDIAGGTANTQIDVMARTNLVVAAGATINSGAGTLSLGADLNADGTGNDGVGTLSIDGGATVISSSATASAITLRGAKMDIATGAIPASVGALGQAITPTATLSGSFTPLALTADSSGNLNGVNGVTVSKFAPAITTLAARATGTKFQPSVLAIDSSGNVYVANANSTTVSEFAPGSTTPTATLSGVYVPDAMACDSSGNLYVANGNGTVSEFARGSTTPTATLTGLNDPDALAIDSSGNLYVANEEEGVFDLGTTVSEFAPGSTKATATLTGLDEPWALAFDSSGNLYVVNWAGNTVSEFAPGSTTPTATLTGLDEPDALAFDPSGNLFVANGNDTVSEFAPGSTTPTATLMGLDYPDALAFDSSGNLYVANWAGNTVSKFAPGSTKPVATLTGLDEPDSLAFDPSGNLYVANGNLFVGITVSKFTPEDSGHTHGRRRGYPLVPGRPAHQHGRHKRRGRRHQPHRRRVGADLYDCHRHDHRWRQQPNRQHNLHDCHAGHDCRRVNRGRPGPRRSGPDHH